MFGQLGYFSKFAGREIVDKRPPGVLDGRLDGRRWIMGDDYSIADIATLGWVRNLITFYEVRELVGYDRFTYVDTWLQRGLTRPAVQRWLTIPGHASPTAASARAHRSRVEKPLVP